MNGPVGSESNAAHSGEESSLTADVAKWLNEQGYPLEMRVAAAFRAHNAHVMQSAYYADPDDGTHREIDVSAWWPQQVRRRDLFARVSCVVECKSGRSGSTKPWVAFSADAHLEIGAFARQQIATTSGRSLLDHLARNNRVELAEVPLFSIPPRLAYGVTEAFTTGKDVPYSAVLAAAKAAESDARARNLQSPPICDVIVPVVVLNGPLLECRLEEGAEQPTLAQVDRAVLAWRNPVSSTPHTIVHIVTHDALDGFATDAAATAECLLGFAASWEPPRSVVVEVIH